jgi:hypothetical protein
MQSPKLNLLAQTLPAQSEYPRLGVAYDWAAQVEPEPLPDDVENVELEYFPKVDLFPQGDPQTDDVQQGNAGNCPLLAIFAAMAHIPAGRSRIKEMISSYTFNTFVNSKRAPRAEPGLTPGSTRTRTKLYIVFKWMHPTNYVCHFLRNRLLDDPRTVTAVTGWLYVWNKREYDPKSLQLQIVYGHSPGNMPSWVSYIEKGYVVKRAYDKGKTEFEPDFGWGVVEDPNIFDVLRDVAGELEWISDPVVYGPDQLDDRHKGDWNDRGLTRVFSRADNVLTVALSRDNANEIRELKGAIFSHHTYAVLGMVGKKVKLYNPMITDAPGSGQGGEAIQMLTLPDFRLGFKDVFFVPKL